MFLGKSTLQLFRAQLILHDHIRAIFQRSLEYAQESGFPRNPHLGFLQGRKMKVVLDTTPILGRGAVKDTYNLLADGIKKLIWALAKNAAGAQPEVWARQQGLGRRYYASSVKGEAEIDWSDEKARTEFLKSIVADADRLLETARQMLKQVPVESNQEKAILEAAQLLAQLLLQDVERPAGGPGPSGEQGDPRLKQGVTPDRIVSVQDPEMRHGHKSASKRFEGFKAAVAVDPDSQLITAVDMLSANAVDSERALELVQASEANTGIEVEETIGDPGPRAQGGLCLWGWRHASDLRASRAQTGSEGRPPRQPGPVHQGGIPNRSRSRDVHLSSGRGDPHDGPLWRPQGSQWSNDLPAGVSVRGGSV